MSSPGYPSQIPVMSLSFPFKYFQVEGLGKLFYPIISLELKTTAGYREFKFLVDTGADVTTIHTDVLPLLGISEGQLKQNFLHGVGGIPIKTYDLLLDIKMGDIPLTIHATAAKTKYPYTPLLLGRKDIFEKSFNLLIDSQKQSTIISSNLVK